MRIGGYETHAGADLFPMMSDEELQKLADDIKANGLREPIITSGGKILDGRNRLRACELAGVAPRFQGWLPPPGQSPITYVVSLNLRRRHLDASERAMIGAKLIPMYEAEAKERQRQGGREKVPAKLPEAGEAREKVAEVVKVSPRLISDAVTVERAAKPEVAKAVQDGKVSVSAAAKALRSPASQIEKARRADREDARRFSRRTRATPWLRQGVTEMAKAIVAGRTRADVRALIKKLQELAGAEEAA